MKYLWPFSILLWAFSSSSVHAKCDENVSCDNLDQCKPYETFRIPFETIRQCIEQGVPPPPSWKPQGGYGVTTGGKGNLQLGGRTDPFFPEMGTGTGSPPPGGGGGGGTNPFAGGPPGPANSNTPDCSGYISPYIVSHCQFRGEELPLSQPPKWNCGYSVKTDHHWAIFTANSNRAAIATPGDSNLHVYVKSGSGLNYQSASAVPAFYCVLKERTNNLGEVEKYAEKVFITPRQLYSEISNRTEFIPVGMNYIDGTVGVSLKGDFIIMDKRGSRFVPPPPNPEYFTSQGAVDVDPDCYSLDQLFTDQLPEGFGEMMFGKSRIDSCEVASVRPHTYLEGEDAKRCLPFIQYYDSYADSLYVPPTSTASYGAITGDKAYSKFTVRAGAGRINTMDNGTPYYDGPTLMAKHVGIFLAAGMSNTNRQTFPAGATFSINPSRTLRVNPPGRVELGNDYRMKLIDGGEILGENGQPIRLQQPESYVQFPDGTPVKGYVSGSIALKAGTTLPANEANTARMPYDSRLDLVCE